MDRWIEGEKKMRSAVLDGIKSTRRTFIKGAVALGAAAALGKYAGMTTFAPENLFRTARGAPGGEAKLVKTICPHCSVGCGTLGKVVDGVFVGQEPWSDNPLNLGGMCSKGASIKDIVVSERRLKYPMEKSGGSWKRISWDEAITRVTDRMKDIREKYGPDSVMILGSAKTTLHESYLQRKFAAFWGTNNVDHQARICHSTTVGGLLNTWGHGAQTDNYNDLRHSKCLFFIGSNAAEAHPVAMQHVLIAKERGAKIIVADPRFTRTAAKADIFIRFRPGTDIPLILSICNVIVNNDWHDRAFIEARTHGFDEFWEVCKDYTPEITEDITGVPSERVKELARIFKEYGPMAILWSMGGTQHSVGSQNIRSYAILQLLLGYVGKSGGGCAALRGHDNVQGSTDMGCLSHYLPGYLGVSSEAAWKMWSEVWGTTYDDMIKRFASKDLMLRNGMTDSRWYEGAIRDDINQPNRIKMLIVWGHSLNSISQMKKEKRALEEVEMIVNIDPRATMASSLPDRKNGIILLPAATVLEKEGMVVTSGRSAQWRYKVIDPLYESKTDLEIMKLMADKLGFGQYFTYSDIDEIYSNEICRGVRSIGLMGKTPERIKKHMENSGTFDPENLQAKGGPCDGEYYGLPWPCWDEKHPGTPLLWDDSKPVSKGGHDFRALWGDKVPDNKYKQHVGENLLKAQGGKKQYSSATGVGYAFDLTGEAVQLALATGDPPTGRGRARFWAWDLTDPVPRHREPIESPRPDLISKYPTYEDKDQSFYRVPCEFKSAQKPDLAEKYPIILTTGRQVEHMGGGAQTRGSKILAEIQPEMYVEINPAHAGNIGVKNGDMVWVESNQGKAKVKAKITERVDQKTVFMPYHWGGMFEGVSYEDRYPEGTGEYVLGDSCNIVTSPGYDEITAMQETKVGLCKVYRA
jgi:formate dehydrogenase major subunit